MSEESFEEKIRDLGPKPMPRPGIYSPDHAAWFRRYLDLFPSGDPIYAPTNRRRHV